MRTSGEAERGKRAATSAALAKDYKNQLRAVLQFHIRFR
jgi:hypothetical protein